MEPRLVDVSIFLYIYWIFIAVETPELLFLSHEVIEICAAVSLAQGACVVFFLFPGILQIVFTLLPASPVSTHLLILR